VARSIELARALREAVKRERAHACLARRRARCAAVSRFDRGDALQRGCERGAVHAVDSQRGGAASDARQWLWWRRR